MHTRRLALNFTQINRVNDDSHVANQRPIAKLCRQGMHPQASFSSPEFPRSWEILASTLGFGSTVCMGNRALLFVTAVLFYVELSRG